MAEVGGDEAGIAGLLAEPGGRCVAKGVADAYDFTDTDGSRPDCWGHIAAYGWEKDDGRDIDEFR